MKAELLNMYSRSETRPKLREDMISRDQYLDLYDSQLEENRVLCVAGEEGVGVTTTLALFARKHGDDCASYFNNGWSRHLLSPQTIVRSLLHQLELMDMNGSNEGTDKDWVDEKNLSPWIYKLSRRAKKKNYLYFVFDGFANIPIEYVDSIKAAIAPLFNIENGRFIFSGNKEEIKQLLPEATPVKQSNEVLKFQMNDVEGYLRKIDNTLTKEDIGTIYDLSNKGEARQLTILTEKLAKDGIETLRAYYRNGVKDFFEDDFAWIEEQDDEKLVQLMTLLTFSEIPQDKQSVMMTLKLTEEEIQTMIEKAKDYVGVDGGIVELKSDDYRKYLRVKLADYKTPIELLLIDMMEGHKDMEEQFLYLPALYKHVKKNKQLVNYLTSENVQNYLVNKRSQAALNEQCEYGYNACNDFETQTAAYFRFAVNRSVSREIEKNELSDEEIEALIAIGDDKSAYTLAQNVFLLEERLKCLLIMSQAGGNLSDVMKDEIDMQICALADAIDFEHIPDKALELAKLMLPVKLEKALEIIDKVAKVTKDQRQIDRLYTAISLSYNSEGRSSDGNQTKADIISTRIMDDGLRKMASVMKCIMADSTAAQVVERMKELPTPSSQLYFLRYWIPDHRKREDIGEAVEYAVKLVIDTSTTSMPKVSFLYQFCKPLAEMSGEQVKKIVGMLDAVVANIKYPTVEYVKLMLLVISAVVKHDKECAKDRLQNLYLEITEMKDRALQAHCKALILRDYEKLGDKKDVEEWMMPAFQLQQDITDDVAEILKNSAYHLKVVEGPIKALVCTAPSFVKEVIALMNTKERRDRAYLLAATEYVWQTDIKKLDWAYFIKLFSEITYDRTELHKPLVALVDKIRACKDKDAHLLEDVKTNYGLLKEVEQADLMCYMLANLYVWVAKYYAGEKFADGSSVEDFKGMVKDDLEHAWNTINMPWLKMRTGYQIAKVMSRISMKQEAKEYVAKCAEVRKSQLLSSYSCVAAYWESLELYVHSLGILIRSKMCTDEDLELFKSLLSYDESEGESIIQWARIALEFYGVDDMDKFNKIVNRYVSKPLDHFSGYYQKLVLYHISPALFLSSKLLFFEWLKNYDTFFQNACLENIARYILTKYPYPEYNNSNEIETQISLERKDYDYLMDLMEHTHDEGFIFNYTDILSRSIKRDTGKTLSRELHKVLFDRLEDIVKNRLPMVDGIQHNGYRIACKAMIDGSRGSGIENGAGLKAEIESVDNKADQAFLYAHVASYLKRSYEKAEFIDLAVQKTEEIDYTFDRFNRYSLCLQDSFDAASAKSKMIAERAMASLKSDKNGKYADYQKMIDMVRDHNEELAESMLEMVDDDPVRIQYKQLLRKRGVSDRRLKAAKEDMQQVARLNNEEQMRFFEKQMEYLIKKRYVVKDIETTASIVQKIYENPITDTRNAVLFFMENLYQKNQANKRYGVLLREMHIAIVDNLKIVLAIASGTKEKLERVNRIMNEHEFESNGFIPVGESEQGLQNIIAWYQEHPVEVLRIIDPFFHPEDLYIIKSLMDLNNDLRCYILTLNKRDATLNEAFQDGWNAISSNLPGRIEVKSCCYENDQKTSPIHDRWWLLYDTENDQYYGKRMASPSVMGARFTEMSDMDEPAIKDTLKIWERFFNNMVQKLEERKLKYEDALLKG